MIRTSYLNSVVNSEWYEIKQSVYTADFGH